MERVLNILDLISYFHFFFLFFGNTAQRMSNENPLNPLKMPWTFEREAAESINQQTN